eukprot:COSAG01_NODE_13421_length_1588_cov_1.198791_2_plen_273_part_00
MRMLRALFGKNGTLIVHDTLQEVGIPAAEYRPFVHAYATATLMGEGMMSNQGTNWSWPRYCASQFRKSNAYGAIKGTGWTGPGISSRHPAQTGPAPQTVNQDLVQLLYGGRDRPGLSGYRQKYLPMLRQLEQVWRVYGNSSKGAGAEDTFYDQYYLALAANLTASQDLLDTSLGRSPMPIADVLAPSILTLPLLHRVVRLHIFRPAIGHNDVVRYTLDGSSVTQHSQLYDKPIEVQKGNILRARNYRQWRGVNDEVLTTCIPPSRELVLQIS